MLSHRTNHVEAGLARLVEQLKDKPKLFALVSALLVQVQGVEDALWQLYTLRSIDTAEGHALDVIGKIVDEPRNAFDDAAYRQHIRARIRASLSSGTVRDILRVFACFGLTSTIERQAPAGFVLRMLDAVPSTRVPILRRFLSEAKAAGVRAVLEWSEYPRDELFAMAFSTCLIADFLEGEMAFTVASTEGFPASGSVVLEPFDPAKQETITYSSKDDTHFYGVFGASVDHFAGAEVVLPGTPGKGFGDAYDPTIGGRFVNVIESE